MAMASPNLIHADTGLLNYNANSEWGEGLRSVGEEYWVVVRPDVYAIPLQNDHYLMYSPMQGLLVLITDAGLGRLLVNRARPVGECLYEGSQSGDDTLLRLFDTRPKSSIAQPMQSPESFRPTRITLSLTSACQLACRYCYIHGGDNPRNMPWEIATAAIRYGLGNCIDAELTEFEVEFHGEGEQTANWPLFVRTIAEIERQCAEAKIRPVLSIVTNGMLNETKVAFLAAHSVGVGLSLDGLKATMDYQRPTRKGDSSFNHVMEAVRLFDTYGIEFKIRSTVTDLNLPEMADFVEFVKTHTTSRFIQFEPVCQEGRALDTGVAESEVVRHFPDAYLAAQEEGRREGVKVNFASSAVPSVRFRYAPR